MRPILEYASTVWSPYVRTDIAKLEMVQRKAARFVFNKFSVYSSVTSMLPQLNWQSLEVRRTNAIITMYYKVGDDGRTVRRTNASREVLSSQQ